MVTIERLLPEHFERVAGWLSKVEVNRWLTGEWRNQKAEPRMLAIASRSAKNRLFLVRLDDTACGLTGLADVDEADHTAMIWYLLGEEQLAGRGITTKAVELTVNFAIADLRMA